MSTSVSIQVDGSAVITNRATGQVTRLTAEGVRLAQSAGTAAEKAAQLADQQMAAERYEVAARSKSPVSQAVAAYPSPYKGVKFLSPNGAFRIGIADVTDETIVDRGPLGQWSLGSLISTGEAVRNADGTVTISDALSDEPGGLRPAARP